MSFDISYLRLLISPVKGKGFLKRFVTGGVYTFLSFLGIGLPILLGYIEEVIRSVKDEEEWRLPPFQPPSILFRQGIRLLPVPLLLGIMAYLLFFVAVPWIIGIGYWFPHERLVTYIVAIPGVYLVIFVIFLYLSSRVLERDSDGSTPVSFKEVSNILKRGKKEFLIYGGLGITVFIILSIPFFFMNPLFFWTFFYGLCIVSAIFGKIYILMKE